MKVLITAGPTYEPIDPPAGPVIVFTTFSSGLENSDIPPFANANSGSMKKMTGFDDSSSITSVI